MVMTLPHGSETKIAIDRVAVRCSGILVRGRRRGDTCNHLLAKVDIDRWEETMTDSFESKCPNDDCGKVYTLAEYR